MVDDKELEAELLRREKFEQWVVVDKDNIAVPGTNERSEFLSLRKFMAMAAITGDLNYQLNGLGYRCAKARFEVIE